MARFPFWNVMSLPGHRSHCWQMKMQNFVEETLPTMPCSMSSMVVRIAVAGSGGAVESEDATMKEGK
jgi:hypothetical protein